MTKSKSIQIEVELLVLQYLAELIIDQLELGEILGIEEWKNMLSNIE